MRHTRILHEGKFYDYPLSFFNILRNFSFLNAIRALLSFCLSRLLRFDPNLNLERWFFHHFGRYLANIFFVPYSEKLWGIRASEIEADFASQRIRNVSLFDLVKTVLHLSFGSQLRTLTSKFRYPIGGSGAFYQKLADRIVLQGGEIKLNAGVKKLCFDGDVLKGVILSSGEVIPCDAIVSTMPLPSLIEALPGTTDKALESARALRFRNTILVYLHLKSRDLFKDQWVYIQSPSLKVGRITNFNNWGDAINLNAEGTVLCLEYWAFSSDSFWKAEDKEIIERAKAELKLTKLDNGSEILDAKVIRIEKSYPVYEIGYRDRLIHIKRELSRFSTIAAIGRYGSFKYNNQDHSIFMGLKAADLLGTKKLSRLWDINSDFDEYQESENESVKSAYSGDQLPITR